MDRDQETWCARGATGFASSARFSRPQKQLYLNVKLDIDLTLGTGNFLALLTDDSCDHVMYRKYDTGAESSKAQFAHDVRGLLDKIWRSHLYKTRCSSGLAPDYDREKSSGLGRSRKPEVTLSDLQFTLYLAWNRRSRAPLNLVRSIAAVVACSNRDQPWLP